MVPSYLFDWISSRMEVCIFMFFNNISMISLALSVYDMYTNVVCDLFKKQLDVMNEFEHVISQKHSFFRPIKLKRQLNLCISTAQSQVNYSVSTLWVYRIRFVQPLPQITYQKFYQHITITKRWSRIHKRHICFATTFNEMFICKFLIQKIFVPIVAYQMLSLHHN